jgi:1,4-dihydroxy-2-naphthoate octaprenyltransferase
MNTSSANASRARSFNEWMVIWLKAARAPFLAVSAIPAMLGGAVAYSHGMFDWTIFLVAFVGVVMAHSAADFIDDYFDFKNGNLANKDQQFHDSPLIRGEITPQQVMVAFLLCMVIALVCGVYLLAVVGMPVLIMTLVGTFIVLFYTSPPIRLNYRGLGETALFVAFGPMIVFGVYFVLTRTFSWEPLLISFPLGVFIMNVGVVSNIFDHDDDVQSGKYTMPVRIGQARSVKLLAVLTIAAYGELAIAAVMGWLPMWSLLGLLTIPLGVRTVLLTAHYTDLQRYTAAMTGAIALSSIMGIVLVAAYGLHSVIG